MLLRRIFPKKTKSMEEFLKESSNLQEVVLELSTISRMVSNECYIDENFIVLKAEGIRFKDSLGTGCSHKKNDKRLLDVHDSLRDSKKTVVLHYMGENIENADLFRQIIEEGEILESPYYYLKAYSHVTGQPSRYVALLDEPVGGAHLLTDYAL